MTYTGAMVLPQDAKMMREEEMRYVDGGATWSKVIKTQNKRYTYKYRVTVRNIGQSTVNLLYGGAATSALIASLAALVGATGAVAVAAAAAAIASVSGIGYNFGELKKRITVTRIR